MTEPITAADYLQQQIGRGTRLRAARGSSPAAAADRELLRRWQAGRLERTHKDFLEDPRYRPAAEFFLTDIYGTGDTTRRDEEIERAYPLMIRTMPDRALRSIGAAFELDALTETLDEQLLAALSRSNLNVAALDERTYAQAFRACDNYDLRTRQIDLIAKLGGELSRLVAKPLLARTLRAMRLPARVAGYGTLQSFLERGFEAFRRMPDARMFVDTVEARERRILDRIYAKDPDPFRTS